ncbi:MAG: hypothetical protein AMJ79_05265 [Phycisphaerae bacterium SM23_30]|nr:MAG: hypothetical protein AMJ79_05265 [Phycisphaerae bacterium SM23_30]
MLLRRPRGYAVDYGAPLVPGPRPMDSVPVPMRDGYIWEPQGISDAEFRRREFMARKPPKIPPPPRPARRGGQVKFKPNVKVHTIEGKGTAAQAARQSPWRGYKVIRLKDGRKMAECPECGTFSDKHDNGLFLCLFCKDWF